MAIEGKAKGLIGKVSKRADAIGGLVGFLTASPSGIEDVKSSFTQMLGGVLHPPEIAEVTAHVTSPYIMPALMGAAAGFVLKYVDVSPITNKIGSLVGKFCIGYAVGGVASKLLWSSTHSPKAYESSGGSAAKGSMPTGRNVRGIYGDFAVQTPYVGTWQRPR